MATHSIFLPGKSHGKRILAGYSLWAHKELDMTEQLTLSFINIYLYLISNVFSMLLTKNTFIISQVLKRNSQTFCLLILNIQSHHLYYQSEMMSSPYLTTKQMSSSKEPSKFCYVDSLQPHPISLLLLFIKGLPGSQCLPSSQKPIYLIDFSFSIWLATTSLSLLFLLIINSYTCSRHCCLEKNTQLFSCPSPPAISLSLSPFLQPNFLKIYPQCFPCGHVHSNGLCAHAALK